MKNTSFLDKKCISQGLLLIFAWVIKDYCLFLRHLNEI